MIISRTPLRITLGGGGTDLPAYASEHGGFAITAALDHHIYVGINKRFDDGYLLRYSETEDVQTIDEIKHPVIREALRMLNIPTGVEIVSMSDIPSGTGLGSSAAFTVGLLKALAAYVQWEVHNDELAEVAAHIELDILNRPGGKQDHWSCAMGGISSLTFNTEGSVDRAPFALGDGNFRLLESSLSLFYTGHRRDADTILSSQTASGLDFIKEIGHASEKVIQCGDINGLGRLMDSHWQIKKQRADDMSNGEINHMYDVAMCNGALGGKLVGAGGGGFLLFVTQKRDILSHAMATIGLHEIPMRFDRYGSTTIASQ